MTIINDMGLSCQQTINRKRKRNDVPKSINNLAENFKMYPNITTAVSEIKSEEHYGPSEPKKNNGDVSKIHNLDHDYLKEDVNKMTSLNADMHNLDEDDKKELVNLHKEYGSKVVGDIMRRLQNILKKGKKKTLSENIVDGVVDESINRNAITKLGDMPDKANKGASPLPIDTADLPPALQLLVNILSNSFSGNHSSEPMSIKSCESIVNNSTTVTHNDGMGKLDTAVSSASISKSEFVMRSSFYNSESSESTINPLSPTAINNINLTNNMTTSAIITSASLLPPPSDQLLSNSQSISVVGDTTSELMELECITTTIEVEKGTIQHNYPFVTIPARLSNHGTIVNSSTTIMSPEVVYHCLAVPTTAPINNINVMNSATSCTPVISQNQNMTACIPVSTSVDLLEQHGDTQGFVSSRSLSSSFPFQPFTTKSSSAAITFADHPLLIRGPAIYENMDISNGQTSTIIKDKVTTSKPLLISSNMQSGVYSSHKINIDKYDSHVEVVEAHSPEKNNYKKHANDRGTEILATTIKPLWVTSDVGRQMNVNEGIEIVHGKGNGNVELIVECGSSGKNDFENSDKEYSFMKYIDRNIGIPITGSFYGFCEEINNSEQENIDMLHSSNQYCDAENMEGRVEYNDKNRQIAWKQSVVQSNHLKSDTTEKNTFVAEVITIDDDDDDDDDDDIEGEHLEHKYNQQTNNTISVNTPGFRVVENLSNPVGNIIQDKDKTYRNLKSISYFEDTDSCKDDLFSDEEKSSGRQCVRAETYELNSSLNSLLYGLNSETSHDEFEILNKNLKQDVHMGGSGMEDAEYSTVSAKQNINDSMDTLEECVDQKTWYKACVQNLCLQDQDGDTILHITIAKEDIRAISIINRIDKYGLNIKNKLGQTPLHLACYIHNVNIIEALLHAGANVDIVDRNGNSPLHIACEERSISMVNCFVQCFMQDGIKLKSMMNMCNNQGLTAIHIATRKGEVPIVKCLVDNGCSLDNQDQKSGATVLVYSLMNCDKELTRLFIDGNAEINTPTFSGHYPLHYAAQSGDIDIVKELVELGAEIGNKLPEFPVDHPDSLEMKAILEKELRKRRRRKKRNKSKLQQYD